MLKSLAISDRILYNEIVRNYKAVKTYYKLYVVSLYRLLLKK